MARYSVKLPVARLKQAGGWGGGADPPICKHNACTMSSESGHMGSVLHCTIVLAATPRGAENAREGAAEAHTGVRKILSMHVADFLNPWRAPFEPWPAGGAGASLEGCWQTLHACALGAKRPFGPRSRTSKVDFTPTKKGLQAFLGPSLDLRGRFQTRQNCCEDFCGPMPLQRWVHFGPRMPAQGLQNTPSIRTSGGSVYLEA